MILFYRIHRYEGYVAYISMMSDHQFLQAKRPAMDPQESRAVLQKQHNGIYIMAANSLLIIMSWLWYIF